MGEDKGFKADDQYHGYGKRSDEFAKQRRIGRGDFASQGDPAQRAAGEKAVFVSLITELLQGAIHQKDDIGADEIVLLKTNDKSDADIKRRRAYLQRWEVQTSFANNQSKAPGAEKFALCVNVRTFFSMCTRADIDPRTLSAIPASISGQFEAFKKCGPGASRA